MPLFNKPISNNLFLTIPSSWTAEMMANIGFDSLTLDMQHSLIDYQTAIQMFQAINTTSTIPLVRARWNEPSHIMQMLDAGARGIICPMIFTAEDAQQFVQACYYPPMGIRSFGPVRAKLYAQEDYFSEAKDLVYTFAMIETAASVVNMEAIAQTEGLTGLYVGPFDLSVSLGLEKRADFNDPALLDILNKVLTITKKNNLKAGIFTVNMEDAKKAATMGFDLVSFGTEAILLEKETKRTLEQWKEE